MQKQEITLRKFLIAATTVIFGLLGTGTGLYLLFWADHQANFYNRGLAQYRTLEFQEAEKSFERSIFVYENAKDRTWIERFVYPKPDRETASLAALHLGNALLRQKNIPKAVKAFKQSIRLNPGTGYSDLPGFPEDLSPADLTRLKKEAAVAKYNLELLLRNNPDIEQKEGKGNKIESKPQEEEKEQIPQIAPGSQPGQGGADDLI